MISLKRLSINKSVMSYYYPSIITLVLSSLNILLLFLFTIILFTAIINNNQITLAIEPIQYAFITSWGSEGRENGQFTKPKDIALDPSGNVYVTDNVENIWTNRIQIFSSDGTFITSWGSQDTENGQFGDITAIAIDSLGNVYVLDRGERGEKPQIQKYTADGTFITSWGSKGSGANGLFNEPTDIAVDSLGNVYVTDGENHRVQKFDSNGKFITKWGSYGTGDGQFDYPSDIAVDSLGNVYVIEVHTDADRVQKFDSNGKFIMKLVVEYLADNIAIDSSDNLYVDTYSTVKRYDSNGNFITEFVHETIISGMVIDSSGHVYMTDYGDSRVEVYAPTV